MARLTAWASAQDIPVGRWCAKVGVEPGLNGQRPKLHRVLSDPDAKVIVVEHLEAALAAQGRRIVVADPGETTDDLSAT